VVKELVENSLDSGADSILVRVKDAGKQLIHIVDNGSGMSREDLELSVTRHATSKILSIEDLELIKSFGFRGEALASIASVANLEIRTKTDNDELGWKLISEPRKELTVENLHLDRGTQVFVRNLFYNIPARRKFLKSNLTEFRNISNTMLKFALSSTDVRLTFYDDEKLIFDVPKGTLLDRIGILMNEETAASVMPIEYDSNGLKLTGYVGKPQLAKKSRTNQFLFLNNRSIVSKSLNYAVFSALEHILEKSSHPFFVINIQVDPKTYDVNVHPQKHEVKFEDERIIYSAIRRSVSNALGKNDFAPSFFHREEAPFTRFRHADAGSGGSVLVNRQTGEVIEPGSKQANNRGIKSKPWEPSGKINHRGSIEPILSAYDEVFGQKEQDKEDDLPELQLQKDNLTDSEKFFWQLHSKYIFTQTADGCIIIDQHAAHERILYERAIRMMEKEFSRSQELLFPIDINLTQSETEIVKEISEELRELGYSFKLLENNKVIISAVPLDTAGMNESKSLKEIIEVFEENQKISNTNKRDNLAASFACKAAIKTGKKLSQEEMMKLYQDLMKCNVPYACPHGRPVVLNLSLDDFDKKFGRLL